MLINDADAIAELTEIYPTYEQALLTNDIAAMMRLFWSSPHVIRFGATENLHGIEEIAAFRAARTATNLARKITRLDITSFGSNAACINLEFERDAEGKIVRGRQSQTWIRMPEGWRIVSAHVSLLP